MTEEKKVIPLFDVLYNAGKEVLEDLKKPLVKKSVKRKLQTAFDDAASKINEANLALQEARKKFDSYDVNVVLRHKAVIEQCSKLQDQIQKEYYDLFATEMPIEA